LESGRGEPYRLKLQEKEEEALVALMDSGTLARPCKIDPQNKKSKVKCKYNLFYFIYNPIVKGLKSSNILRSRSIG
jgi:hypothetical protein